VAVKHQKANGQVERAIQTIKRMLVKVCNNRPKGWMNNLAAVRSAFNCALSETTGVSPYFALMGFERKERRKGRNSNIIRRRWISVSRLMILC
jgi:hypothetical protein